MTEFKEDFDNIVIDLCGEPLPEKESGPSYDDDYVGFLYDKINQYQRQIDDDFIETVCRKHQHNCPCGKSYILYIYEMKRSKLSAQFDFDRAFDMNETISIQKRSYRCLDCGQPFQTVNGEILRIELTKAELSEYYNRRRN